jgi:hypothetical protein
MFCTILLLALLLSGCDREMHSVRYEISGTPSTVSLSYENATGGSEQRDVHPPWTLSFQTLTWEHIGITVFNPNFSGSVTCRLYVDGRLIQEATSEGGFKWATCDGLAGVTNEPTPTP